MFYAYKHRLNVINVIIGIVHLYVNILWRFKFCLTGHPLPLSYPPLPNNHSPIIFPNFIICCLYTFIPYKVILLIYLYICLFCPLPLEWNLYEREGICQSCPLLSSHLLANHLTPCRYSVKVCWMKWINGETIFLNLAAIREDFPDHRI